MIRNCWVLYKGVRHWCYQVKNGRAEIEAVGSAVRLWVAVSEITETTLR